MDTRQTDLQTEIVGKLLEELPETGRSILSFRPGETIVAEGQPNNRLLILSEGEAKLCKYDQDDFLVEADAFGPGSILGLTSFWTRRRVFATIESANHTRCIAITRPVFDKLVRDHPEFRDLIQDLFVSNLSRRYRHLVESLVERSRLERQLKEEHNHLRETLRQLEETTNRLINQEKLATMGQLLAGIAHEINNPVGALLRSVETAEEMLLQMVDAASNEDDQVMIREGLACPFWSSEDKRARMEKLELKMPDTPRSLLRRLAQLSDKAQKLIEPFLASETERSRLLAIYDLGICFRGAGIAATRIESIVRGLKNYGRSVSTNWSDANLVDGIKDTLTVLNNRLKRYDLILNLEELPTVSCNLGEMNQVWTNLLVNAMDATSEGESIRISSSVEDNSIVILIEDGGSGIEESKLKTVFQPNYTTKNQSGSFGLGLGLSISHDIIEKHGGSIRADRSKDLGGALFEVKLPIQ